MCKIHGGMIAAIARTNHMIHLVVAVVVSSSFWKVWYSRPGESTYTMPKRQNKSAIAVQTVHMAISIVRSFTFLDGTLGKASLVMPLLETEAAHIDHLGADS